MLKGRYLEEVQWVGAAGRAGGGQPTKVPAALLLLTGAHVVARREKFYKRVLLRDSGSEY